MKKTMILSAAGTIAAFLIVGCAYASGATIRITCWAGYAKPFVDDFTALMKKKHDTDVSVIVFNPTDQDEFYAAAKQGTADLIGPPADMAKTPRFYCFEKGRYLLAPLDLDNIPNFKTILPYFKADASLIHDGRRYGLPYNCGPYGLAYNTTVVTTAPQSWNVLWEPRYKGAYTLNNNFHKCNIWITALALGYSYEHIFDIDRLDRARIQKKLTVLARNAKSLWDGAANPDEFPGLSLATTWGFAAQQANRKGGRWMLASPREGGTAWIDYWCITHAATGKTRKLCEEWINYQLSPHVQKEVVRSQGVSPVVDTVAPLLTREEIGLFHVGDNDYFKTVAIWRVMSEKTEKAFAQMWEEAKKSRKKTANRP